MVSSVLFLLAGRALPEATAALKEWPFWRLAASAAGLLGIVLAVQFAFSLAAAVLKPIAGALGNQRPGSSRLAAAGVMAWASTRSVIALVIGLAIPATLPNGWPFPERDLILVVAALLVVGSVLLQGLSLRAVVWRAELCEEGEEQREEDAAKRAIAEA